MLKRNTAVALDLSSSSSSNMAPIDLSQSSTQPRSHTPVSASSATSVNRTASPAAPSTPASGQSNHHGGASASPGLHLTNGTPANGEATETTMKEVICLSDDDEDEIERLARKTAASEDEDSVDPELMIERKRMLRKLRNSLRAEETKLYLLKRMRISQRPLREGTGGTSSGSTNSAAMSGNLSSGNVSCNVGAGNSGVGQQIVVLVVVVKQVVEALVRLGKALANKDSTTILTNPQDIIIIQANNSKDQALMATIAGCFKRIVVNIMVIITVKILALSPLHRNHLILAIGLEIIQAIVVRRLIAACYRSLRVAVQVPVVRLVWDPLDR